MRIFLIICLFILFSIPFTQGVFAQIIIPISVAPNNKSSFYLSDIQVSSVANNINSSGAGISNNSILNNPVNNIISDTLTHVSDSMNVSLTLKLNNLQKIDSIEIRYGSEKGDFISMSLKHVIINGKDYLKWYDYTYPIINNIVVLTGGSTGLAYQQATLMVLNAKDYSGNKSSIIPQK